jgi:hypothetical protein
MWRCEWARIIMPMKKATGGPGTSTAGSGKGSVKTTMANPLGKTGRASKRTKGRSARGR